MDFSKMKSANKRMALLATGGLGVWALIALRQAARRSSSTLARSTTTLQSPITPVQQDRAVAQYMQQQPIQPGTTAIMEQAQQNGKRQKYEILWTDDWDFDSTQW